MYLRETTYTKCFDKQIDVIDSEKPNGAYKAVPNSRWLEINGKELLEENEAYQSILAFFEKEYRYTKELLDTLKRSTNKLNGKI